MRISKKRLIRIIKEAYKMGGFNMLAFAFFDYSENEKIQKVLYIFRLIESKRGKQLVLEQQEKLDSLINKYTKQQK